MDSTIGAAIIGSGGAIIAAFIPFLWRMRKTSARNEAYDKVTGSITAPQPEQTVGRTFQCSGTATGMQPGLSLWLAVEAGGLVWPKESKVDPDKDNKWSVTVFEDGSNETFSVALFVMDTEVDKRLRKWLEKGRCNGTYSECKGIPGARRLARVDGLRLEK